MDRRILYEVTGFTLIKDEFIDEDSSDSDGERPAQDLMDNDPLEQAFNYRQVGQSETNALAINP